MVSIQESKFSFPPPTTPLHNYAKSGNTREILNLLSSGYNINVKDIYGNTPLMFAVVVNENISVIELLLTVNADIYTTNNEGLNALSIVVKKSHEWLATLTPKLEHLNILELFFLRIKYDFLADKHLTVKKLKDARCPLALIQFMNSPEITQYFLENNFNLEELVGGFSALHLAVLRQDIESVKLFVDYNEYLNTTDLHNGQSVLFAHNVDSPDKTDNKTEILKILFNHGASLHVPRKDGVTPMEYLLKNGNRNTRLIVLENNSFQNCNSNGGTALHYLLQNEKINYLPKEEIWLLLSKGYNINMRDKDGLSALMWCIKKKIGRYPEFLTKNGAEINWVELVVNTNILQAFMNFKFESKREYYQQIIDLILCQRFNTNSQQLFKDMNNGFSRKPDNIFFAQILIAHLAISEVAKKTIPYSTFDYIDSKVPLREYYNICKILIKQMEEIKINDLVTLLQLLIESDEKIDSYICNEDFLSELRKLLNEKSYRKVYYFIIIRKRIENAIRIRKLRKISGRTICKLTGLDKYGVGKHDCIVYKILSYLSNTDVVNILEGQSIHVKNPVTLPKAPEVVGSFICRSLKKIFL